MAKKEMARKQSKQQEEALIMPDHPRKDSQPQANAVSFGASSDPHPPSDSHPTQPQPNAAQIHIHPSNTGPPAAAAPPQFQPNALQTNNFPSNAPPRILQRPSNATSPPLTNFPPGYNHSNAPPPPLTNFPPGYKQPKSIWAPPTHLFPSNYVPSQQYNTYRHPSNEFRKVSGPQQVFYTPPTTATSNASFGPGMFSHGAPPHTATSNASFVSNPFPQGPAPPSATSNHTFGPGQYNQPPHTATSNASFVSNPFAQPTTTSNASFGSEHGPPPPSAPASSVHFYQPPSAAAQEQPHPSATTDPNVFRPAVFDQPPPTATSDTSFDPDLLSQLPPGSDTSSGLRLFPPSPPPNDLIAALMHQISSVRDNLSNVCSQLQTPVAADYAATKEREVLLGRYLRELLPGLAALSQDASSWFNEVMGCNDAGVRVNVGGREL